MRKNLNNFARKGLARLPVAGLPVKKLNSFNGLNGLNRLTGKPDSTNHLEHILEL